MLDVFFRDDIFNAIAGNLYTALATSQAQGITNTEFIRGMLAGAHALCKTLGVDWQAVLADVQRQGINILESGAK